MTSDLHQGRLDGRRVSPEVVSDDMDGRVVVERTENVLRPKGSCLERKDENGNMSKNLRYLKTIRQVRCHLKNDFICPKQTDV